MKISDLTAKYGRDYTISILDSKEKVENPSDNESLLEMMEGEEYTESELVTEEDYLSQMEEDDELYQATVDAYNDAIEYIESESGVDVSEDPDTENDPATQPEESVEGENSDAGATEYTDPLQQARSLFTGISGQPQQVTSTTDTFQQIQDMANVITNAVVGATLTVDFAAGEQEKYLVIDVKDNWEGDGTRYFYLMLGGALRYHHQQRRFQLRVYHSG